MVRPPLGGKLGGTPHEIGVSDITVVFLKLETSSFLQSSSFELYFIMKEPGYDKTPPTG